MENLKILDNPNIPEEQKAKLINEISESFDTICNAEKNQNVLEIFNVLMNYLKNGEYQFFSENPTQKIRKTVLEMMHRLPMSESFRPHVISVLSLMLTLIREDNEENVLISLRIIIDLHKQYRPPFYPQIKEFLAYIQNIYSNLPHKMDKIFDPRYSRLDKANFNIDDIYTLTNKILPRGRNSFKVLQELPIVLVLLYQLYKQNIHDHVVAFLPAILTTVTLEPKKEFRDKENFNRELFVDFLAAQIKQLAFLAYTIKTFPGGLMEIIEAHAKTLVEGMILLLRLCPKEVAHLRKELLVATRHILATSLRTHFIPSLELLFDEDLLLGKSGYTALCSLRPLAFSTLGDFIHQVRLELSLDILSKAIALFSKNIHDETLPLAIQIMSIRLLLNLVECIRNQRHDQIVVNDVPIRKNLLQSMMKVFILKFHTIGKMQMPVIIEKWKSSTSQQTTTNADQPIKEFTSVEIIPEAISKLTSIGFTPPSNLNLSEYKLLIKSLIGGIKTIVFGINFLDSGGLLQPHQQMSIVLSPQEVQYFIDFFIWSLDAFYIYRINSSNGAQKIAISVAAQREEKELLELFSGLFLNLSSQNFQEIFTATIEILIEKMKINQNLQIIINTFLSYRATSPLFASVMVEYLLKRMDVIGSNDIEMSNLYLKMFKLIFGSVSMFCVENEGMIRPYLQTIVINSMEMAMRSEEPYNYFLLLRALFRSIGGGTYDILYQEFLPLLPNLLSGLNRLQSGCHEQQMKDLFVELCLTVPVRLSSLLPFLPMLMDPLVSALNGSPTLVNQGLRTLELCVDNLLPDFFCDHIQPVRAELMQSLWKTLRNLDNSSMGAFRILGKFGGGNRNMLIEPQKIEHQDTDRDCMSVSLSYSRKYVQIPADAIILSAYQILKNTSNTSEVFYMKESWNVVKFFLFSTMDVNDDKNILYNLLQHSNFTMNESLNDNYLKNSSNFDKNTMLKCLAAMFLAANNKEIGSDALAITMYVVERYVIIAIAHQTGMIEKSDEMSLQKSLLIFDALLSLMDNEDKTIYNFATSILQIVIKISTYILGSMNRTAKLPMMQYIFEKVINLLYDKSSYARKGGCIIIKFLCQNLPATLFFKNLFSILKAHLFVIRDLSDNVCRGTIDVAEKNIEYLIEMTISYVTCENITEDFIKIYNSLVNEFVLQTASPHKFIRQVATKSLKQIAAQQKITVSTLLEPYKSFFSDVIVFSPAKTYLRHQPLSSQVGILEANFFCTSLEPKLMRFDNYQFLNDVKIIIKYDDDTMSRWDAYKDVKLLPELRESAMRVLVSWHYIYHNQHYDTEKLKNINHCDDVFIILFKALENYQSLQKTAFECLKKLIDECKEKTENGWPVQHSFLETLGDYSSWTANSIKRLSYYCLLFPKMFTEKTCDQLFEIVKKLLQNSIIANKDQNYLKIAKTGETELKIAAIIDLFHLIPTCSAKFVILLIRLVMTTEETVSIETSCPYREPLIKFLLRYPEETITFLLADDQIRNQKYNRFIVYLLKHKDGNSFKSVMENRSARLKELILRGNAGTSRNDQNFFSQYHAILIVKTITELNNQWLSSQMDIVNALNHIWKIELSKNVEQQNMVCDFWHLVVKILLHYFQHNPGDIELLFQLLNIYNSRFVPDFQFFRDFIYTICQNYTVDWKRNAFFMFVDYYTRPNVTIDLKIKILTMILIPSFAISFEKGEESRLIRGHAQDEDSNIISVFINKIVNPFMMKESDDGLRIVLLQFACLLVERASAYIQSNKKEEIRQLTTFGYSSLLHSKNYWDPTAVYNGHLLLSHIIAKLANKKSWQEVVFKVFHSLLKAHAIEARNIVRQTLEVFMPMMPLKMDSQSNLSLINLTKSVIIKDGYAILQLYHVFQVIIRHHSIYYPVRHEIIQNMIQSMQRLESSNSVDYRKLAIDIAEVIINWELKRIKESAEENYDQTASTSGALKRSHESLPIAIKKQAIGENSPQPGTSLMQTDEVSNKPIEWVHCRSVINFLFDLLFMLSEQTTTQLTSGISPNEVICKHSLNLLRKVLKKDVWIRDEELPLTRLKKVFEEPSKVSSTTISNFLEIFIHLLDEMDSKILMVIKTLQPGLAICITSAQTKVLRLMSTFLSKLFTLFPPENYMKHDELRFLYQTVEKAIRNGLEIFEKDSETPTASFFGTFLILKTAFSNDTKYFEKFVEKFTRFVVLLKTDHLNVNSQQPTTPITSPNTELTKEMLMQSLHLLKTYLNIMSSETRRTYINVILIDLIEKSNDAKIMKTIIQLLENWFHMKNPLSEPCLREKILLLQKLTYHIENRFNSEIQLNTQFLELIYFIYSNPEVNTIELTSKLDRAFLAGLKCSQYEIRQKFFNFFHNTVDKNVYTRLLYILSTRTWDSIGHHYWIKQCIELIFLTCDRENIFEMTAPNYKLPKITLTSQMSELFSSVELEDFKDNYDAEKCEDITQIANAYNTIQSRDLLIKKIVSSQMKFSNHCQQFSTENFLKAVVQICHVDGKLSEKLWIKTFPQLWSNFELSQRKSLTKEIIPFLSTGTKVTSNGNLSALNTFVQALSVCNPPVFISPKLMKSISKVHNVWHTATLLTEDMVENYMNEVEETDEFELDENVDEGLIEIYGSLSSLYSSLKEKDLWAGLWKTHAKYPETNAAIFFEQMGYFDEAQNIYESVMLKFKQEVSNGMNTVGIATEIELWEDHWIRCTRELNEWSNLMNYAQTNRDKYIMLLIESAWKLSDWNLMCSSFIRAEQLISKQNNYKLGLFGGYISLLCQKETVIAKYIEIASTASLQEWRQLPHVVSNVHIPILQVAQQIMELQEAGQIHQDLLRKQALPFHDMKSIIKTWRNRLPIVSDDFSFFKELFVWRLHHYKLIVESANGNNVIVANLGSQASAQSYIKLAKVARKHNLTTLCQKSLSEIDTISSIPLSDCFQKIVQQIKNLITTAQYSSDSKTNLSDALKIAENVNLELFQPESKAILCAYKGYLNSFMGNSTEANKAFTTAVDLCDGSSKVWSLYGEYMENIFKQNSKKSITPGVSAITCYLHASRDHNEMKARKYLAKVIYLLTYDEARVEMLKVLDNYMLGVPMINWLSWIPQLFNILVQYEGDTIMNLLNQIAKIFPQAVYFPIRTLYLSLKIEQRERYKNIEHFKNFGDQAGTSSSMNQPNLKSTAAMWRCSKIMQLVKEIHPTIVCSLENILDQLMSKSDIDGIRYFRENVFEENLHQLKQGLAKCYAIAYDNRLSINEATTTQHTLNFIRKLISNFTNLSIDTSGENLLQDPVFTKLRQQFSDGFSFTQPESNKLIDLIRRLKTCIKIMEEKVKYLSKSFLIEEKYRFLSNFNQKTAEIDLPGELLLPRHSHYHIKIAKFMPRVEIVQKHNTSARRLFIQGTNGKIYPYLVVNDSGMIDARREERILQLLRMVNGNLMKFKETSKRFLHITVPRVIAIFPQVRLVEEKESSLSLLDILKSYCSKRNTEFDAPIARYYERLAEIQLRGAQTTHVTLRDIFREIQREIPKTVLKDWASKTFASATDYWTFRKVFTTQHALWSLVEYAFHLTRLNPEMMYLHQDSGLINVSYFKFDLEDSSDTVPFRLTPNITEFMTTIGINGPFTAVIMATARCFLQPNYQVASILKTILRDEFITIHRKHIMSTKPIDINDDLSQDKTYSEINSENVLASIESTVNVIIKRLEELMHFDPTEDSTKVAQLIQKAKNYDYLSHMDAIYNPWL